MRQGSLKFVLAILRLKKKWPKYHKGRWQVMKHRRTKSGKPWWYLRYSKAGQPPRIVVKDHLGNPMS